MAGEARGKSDKTRERTQNAKGAWTVVDGGRLHPTPRLLALGASPCSEGERLACAHAASCGLEVVELEGESAQHRAEKLAALCSERGLTFRDVAVVAVDPVDTDAFLEAGVGFALMSAGYDACAAADRVFPPRADGGLEQAIEAVADVIRPRGRG